jgi:hypothetical protein
MFQTVVESIGTAKIKDAIDELESLIPPPMNTMLNKQPQVEAIAKKKKKGWYGTRQRSTNKPR